MGRLGVARRLIAGGGGAWLAHLDQSRALRQGNTMGVAQGNKVTFVTGQMAA